MAFFDAALILSRGLVSNISVVKVKCPFAGAFFISSFLKGR